MIAAPSHARMPRVRAVAGLLPTADPTSNGGRWVIWIELNSTLDATLTRSLVRERYLIGGQAGRTQRSDCAPLAARSANSSASACEAAIALGKPAVTVVR